MFEAVETCVNTQNESRNVYYVGNKQLEMYKENAKESLRDSHPTLSACFIQTAYVSRGLVPVLQISLNLTFKATIKT